MDVKRWIPDVREFDGFQGMKEGEDDHYGRSYVLYSDYAALEQKVEELEQQSKDDELAFNHANEVVGLLEQNIVATPLAAAASAGDSICQRCGTLNPVWFAPNALWNRVISERVGVYCPNCFIAIASERGITATWELVEEADLAAARLVVLNAARRIREGENGK